MCRTLLSVCCFFLISCSQLPSESALDQGQWVDVHVEMIGQARWRVRVDLPNPTNQLVFRRTPALDLRERWRLLDADKTLQKNGKRDVVVGSEVFESVSFEIAADERFVRADYSLTQTFAQQSGIVLYLGHFVATEEGACPELTNSYPPCSVDTPLRFHITPQQGEHVWLAGELHDGPFTVVVSDGDGGMAYFGQLEPRQVGIWQILTGPNVPAWMVRDLSTLTPKLTALYTQWLGQPLNMIPQLMFSAREGNGQGAHGGVIKNMVHFTIQGSTWQTENAVNRSRYFELVAHEVAHLWNGSMFSHEHATGASWMHEGGADALKRRAGLELGLLSAEAVWNARTLSLSQCMDPSTRPLNEAGKRGSFYLYYPCGEMIELIVEGALRKRGLDPFAHWAHMFNGLDDQYSADLYFQSVAALTGDDELVAELRRYVFQGLAGSQELLALVEAAGVKIANEKDAHSDGIIREMLRHLHKQDCSGGFSLSGRDGQYTLLASERCLNTPKPGLQVTKVAGIDLSAEENALAAFTVVSHACENHEVVELQGVAGEREKTIEITCAEQLRYANLVGWQDESV